MRVAYNNTREPAGTEQKISLTVCSTCTHAVKTCILTEQ